MAVSRLRRVDFTFLFDKVLARISGWNQKALSFASRVTILHPIQTSMLQYAISCRSMPWWFCIFQNGSFEHFLWGHASQGKGCILLLGPKSLGGLGFQTLASMQQALLAKVATNLVLKPHSLWAQLVIGGPKMLRLFGVRFVQGGWLALELQLMCGMIRTSLPPLAPLAFLCKYFS